MVAWVLSRTGQVRVYERAQTAAGLWLSLCFTRYHIHEHFGGRSCHFLYSQNLLQCLELSEHSVNASSIYSTLIKALMCAKRWLQSWRRKAWSLAAWSSQSAGVGKVGKGRYETTKWSHSYLTQIVLTCCTGKMWHAMGIYKTECFPKFPLGSDV